MIDRANNYSQGWKWHSTFYDDDGCFIFRVPTGAVPENGNQIFYDKLQLYTTQKTDYTQRNNFGT